MSDGFFRTLINAIIDPDVRKHKSAYSDSMTAQQLASIDVISLLQKGRDYKAPHAYRPTQPRKHFHRGTKRKKIRALYLKKFEEQRGYPLPVRFQNASRTFDVLAAPDRRIIK